MAEVLKDTGGHWMFLLIFKFHTSHLACVATKACATRATSFHKILALWALSLCHYSGQDSVAIGSPSHGRPASFQNVEVNVGCFTDFLVYFLQLEGTPFSFLQQVCDVVAEADANSLLPFGEISREVWEINRDIQSSKRCLRGNQKVDGKNLGTLDLGRKKLRWLIFSMVFKEIALEALKFIFSK